MRKDPNMRYMILLKGIQPASPPAAELMDAIMKLGEEATNAGALLDTAGLAPSALGPRLQLTGGSIRGTGRPFARAMEMISYGLCAERAEGVRVEWTNPVLRRGLDFSHEL